ncbi:hypothetical protein BHE74_00048608 [Ensete ventricosum]|nr:hypothetical protein GW17_00029699 [Ensete ventricosum]RWW45543.1 hypothetical protein BHE74_00048608 [Ensete ventricosum]RZS14745.1 hypothetical protein BHM03_00046476 [Ensete ventricosum]
MMDHQRPITTNSLFGFESSNPRPGVRGEGWLGGGGGPAVTRMAGPSPKLTVGGDVGAPSGGRRRKQHKVGGTEQGGHVFWYGIMITLVERKQGLADSHAMPCHAVGLMADGCVSPAVCRFPLMNDGGMSHHHHHRHRAQMCFRSASFARVSYTLVSDQRGHIIFMLS